MRTVLRRSAARVTAVVVIALVALCGCTPPTTGGGGTDYSKCPTPGAGDVRVAMVVDATALGGTSNVVCVVVAQGASGVTALYARAARLGTTPPRFDASGLLCGIDGAPAAPACGTVGPSGYQYWSYWVGGSTWTYAAVGPASRSMQDGTVEGWRFQLGGANTAPSTSASFSQLVS